MVSLSFDLLQVPLRPNSPPDPDPDPPHPVVSPPEPPDPPVPPDPASFHSTVLGLSATQSPSLSRRLLHSLNLHVPFAMSVAIAGDPLLKSPELFLAVPPPPVLQLVARTLGRRVVCYKPNSLSLQIRQVCYVSDPASSSLEGYRFITECVALLGSFYLSMRLLLPQYEDVTLSLSMRLPLPQYEDVTLALCRLLPLFEVFVRNLQSISVTSFVHLVWLTRVVMVLDFVRRFWCCEPLKCFPFVETSSFLGDINLVAGLFHLQDSSGSFVSHLSLNGHLASALVAVKLALSTALLEAAFAGLIALDVLFDSQSLNPPLISKDVKYLYEIRCLSVEFNCICFPFVSCPTMVMVWFVVNNSSSNGV